MTNKQKKKKTNKILFLKNNVVLYLSLVCCQFSAPAFCCEMASAVESSELLLSCPWASVDIDESRFLCKSWFGQSQYHVLLMDSDCLWEEQMEAAEIQGRAQVKLDFYCSSFQTIPGDAFNGIWTITFSIMILFF